MKQTEQKEEKMENKEGKTQINNKTNRDGSLGCRRMYTRRK
jgi:hypothetical protein